VARGDELGLEGVVAKPLSSTYIPRAPAYRLGEARSAHRRPHDPFCASVGAHLASAIATSGSSGSSRVIAASDDRIRRSTTLRSWSWCGPWIGPPAPCGRPGRRARATGCVREGRPGTEAWAAHRGCFPPEAEASPVRQNRSESAAGARNQQPPVAGACLKSGAPGWDHPVWVMTSHPSRAQACSYGTRRLWRRRLRWPPRP
jgi:hypothetical protein